MTIDLDRYNDGKPATFGQCQQIIDAYDDEYETNDGLDGAVEIGWRVYEVAQWALIRATAVEKNLTDTQETCTRQLLENRKQREDAARTEASMRAILAAREGETSWQAACRVMVELAETRSAKELAESNAGHDHDEAVQLKTENLFLREQLGRARAHVRTLMAKLDEQGGM